MAKLPLPVRRSSGAECRPRRGAGAWVAGADSLEPLLLGVGHEVGRLLVLEHEPRDELDGHRQHAPSPEKYSVRTSRALMTDPENNDARHDAR